jgi:hypothetical protein
VAKRDVTTTSTSAPHSATALSIPFCVQRETRSAATGPPTSTHDSQHTTSFPTSDQASDFRGAGCTCFRNDRVWLSSEALYLSSHITCRVAFELLQFVFALNRPFFHDSRRDRISVLISWPLGLCSFAECRAAEPPAVHLIESLTKTLCRVPKSKGERKARAASNHKDRLLYRFEQPDTDYRSCHDVMM